MADDLKPLDYESRLDAFELYHLVLEDGDKSHRGGGPILPALGHAISGSTATAASKLLIYPLDLVITRLQVQKQLKAPKGARTNHSEYKGLLDAASKIYRHEGGIRAFYTGCWTDVGKGIADSFLFFLAYNFLQQRRLQKTGKKRMSVPEDMAIGIISGAFSKLITTPLQNIITRQQTAALAIAHDTEADDSLKKGDQLSIADIARQIHEERGLAGFWTGYSLSLVLTLNPALTFAVDNFLQKTLRAKDAGSHVTFLVAAVSKAIASTITYPVSVAKARAQARSGTEAQKPASTNASGVSKLSQLFAAQYAVLLSIRRIYQQDGLGGLYSGIEAEVLKGFLSHGLTMMMKDRVHGFVIELYYVLLRLTSNWPAELVAKQEAAGELLEDASERVENVATTAYEAATVDNAKQFGQSAVAATRDAAADAASRAENIGSTVAEASKSAASGLTDSAKSTATSAWQTGESIASEARKRAENVAVTVVEGGKSAAGKITEQASSIATNASEGAKHAVADAQQRLENVGVTIVEAGKSIVREDKK